MSPASFDRAQFNEAQFSMIPRLLPGRAGEHGVRHGELLRKAMGEDRQRPLSRGPPISGMNRVAFRTPFDKRRLGPSIARPSLALGPQPGPTPLDVAPSPQTHAAPVAGVTRGSLDRPLYWRSKGSRAATLGRTSRNQPANAAVQQPDPRLGPGCYTTRNWGAKQREFGDFDESMPGGFGRGSRTSFKSAQTESDEQGPVDLMTCSFDVVPAAAVRGGRFLPVPERGPTRPNGPLDGATSTSEEVAPGTYRANQAYDRSTRPHTASASLVGRPKESAERNNLGPTTYNPFSPFGTADAPRETTPAGSGGLRYSFSASCFHHRAMTEERLLVRSSSRRSM